MARINIILIVLLVCCALLLVTSQDRARKSFVELERVQAQMRKLEVQANQLELDQSKLSKSSLVTEKARRDLAMRPATPERTLHVNLQGEVDRQARTAPDAKAVR